MRSVQLTVDGEPGFLFECDVPGLIAFVPEHCVVWTDDDSAVIDQVAYFLSGWADRNARFGDTSLDLGRAFPQANRPVMEPDDHRLKSLLERLRHVYRVSLETV